MVRIIYVCEYAILNGGERSLLAWLPTVLSEGIEVNVLAPGDGPLASTLRALGIAVVPWRIDQATTNRLAARREKLAEVVADIQPDLIHANSLSMSRVVGPVASQLGVTSLGHLRDIIGISAKAMSDINANTRLLAVSHATAHSHIARGLDPSRTHVLYNGVDMQTFAPRPPTGYLQRELKLPTGTRLLGAVGQVGMRKGLDVLLAAAAIAGREFSDFQLLIVGQRSSGKDEAIDYEQHLHRLAAQLPLAGRVHFLGVRTDMPQLLNELTLLVHAARQEPLGRVLLEAAASGVPVIATDVGGTREIFSGEEAALVPADDVSTLAYAIADFLRIDGNKGHLVGWTTTQREQFDARLSATNLLNHYRALCDGNT